MFDETDTALSGIEEKMLEAFNTAFERWEDQAENAPLPMSLVAAFKSVHSAILTRLAKRGGFDMQQMMKHPEAGLVMLDRMKATLLKMIEQREKLKKTEGRAS
jgi:hypothetical protein